MLLQPRTSILPHHSTPHLYTLQTSISNPSQKNKTTQKRNNAPSKIANLGRCQKTLASPIHCFSPPLNTSLHSFRIFHPPPSCSGRYLRKMLSKWTHGGGGRGCDTVHWPYDLRIITQSRLQTHQHMRNGRLAHRVAPHYHQMLTMLDDEV